MSMVYIQNSNVRVFSPLDNCMAKPIQIYMCKWNRTKTQIPKQVLEIMPIRISICDSHRNVSLSKSEAIWFGLDIFSSFFLSLTNIHTKTISLTHSLARSFVRTFVYICVEYSKISILKPFQLELNRIVTLSSAELFNLILFLFEWRHQIRFSHSNMSEMSANAFTLSRINWKSRQQTVYIDFCCVCVRKF